MRVCIMQKDCVQKHAYFIVCVKNEITLLKRPQTFSLSLTSLSLRFLARTLPRKCMFACVCACAKKDMHVRTKIIKKEYTQTYAQATADVQPQPHEPFSQLPRAPFSQLPRAPFAQLPRAPFSPLPRAPFAPPPHVVRQPHAPDGPLLL